MPSFSAAERERLDALLEATRQIQDASIVAEGQPLAMRGSANQGGQFEQSYTLFDSEPFRSLAMSVRLVYMNDEPANFGGICNILYKNGDQDLQKAVADLRKAYSDFLSGSTVRYNLHGDLEGTSVGPREVFETWLYGGAFHQDPNRKAMYLELTKFGQNFTFGLHLIVTRIVQLMLHLGLLVSTALREEERQQAPSPPVA